MDIRITREDLVPYTTAIRLLRSIPQEMLCDVVWLLDCYFSKIPCTSILVGFFFYLQPRVKVPEDPSAPWFHKTHSALKCARKQAKRLTIHSLRATGATTMFNAQVPEKMIKEVTGHCSSKALALYERPQKQAVSKVLAEGESFDQEVKSIAQQQQTSSFNGAHESAIQPMTRACLCHPCSLSQTA